MVVLLGGNMLVDKDGWLITSEWVITVDDYGIKSIGDIFDAWFIPWKNIDSISYESKNDRIHRIIINRREDNLTTKAYIKIEKHKNLLTIYNIIKDKFERYKMEAEQERQKKLAEERLTRDKAEKERQRKLIEERLTREKAEQERQRKLVEENSARIKAEEIYFRRITRLQDIQNISPVQFEKLIGMLFQKMGFSVLTTSITRDEGIDLVLDKNGKTSIVQCKRFNGSVGQPIIRDLYGTMIHNRAYDAYLITTGTFSLPAKSWASGKPIHLVDGSMLIEWIESFL